MPCGSFGPQTFGYNQITKTKKENRKKYIYINTTHRCKNQNVKFHNFSIHVFGLNSPYREEICLFVQTPVVLITMGDVIKIFAIANGNSISNNFKKFYNIYD